MGRPTIAILFGGRSEEHDISVKSATEVARWIDEERYEPIFVGIGRSGAWTVCGRPGPGWEQGDLQPVVLCPDPAVHGLLVGRPDGWRTVRLDAVFPVLHGRLGEDGAIQGLLELSGVPYVGCDVQSSAICMDKSLAYVLARGAGIDTPAFRVLTASDGPTVEGLSYPLFVKPARSGSSFGVTRVERPDELADAVRAARRYDRKVLVEQAVDGTEVGCAVLGHAPDVTTGEVDQIELTHGIFRIHQESEPEQGSENAVITVPAPLPDEVRARIRDAAVGIYEALGCSGLARVDMFLRPDGGIVLNEVNTLPGFTSYSRYPRMMAAAGIDGPELVDRCLAAAMGR